jgi:hypothetical protein
MVRVRIAILSIQTVGITTKINQISAADVIKPASLLRLSGTRIRHTYKLILLRKKEESIKGLEQWLIDQVRDAKARF